MCPKTTVRKIVRVTHMKQIVHIVWQQKNENRKPSKYVINIQFNWHIALQKHSLWVKDNLSPFNFKR